MDKKAESPILEKMRKRLNQRLDAHLPKEADALKLQGNIRQEVITAARKAGEKIYAEDEALGCLNLMICAQQAIHEVIAPLEKTHNFDADGYDHLPQVAASGELQYTDIKVRGIDRNTKKPIVLQLDKADADKLHNGIMIQSQAEIGLNDLVDKLVVSNEELQLLPATSLKLVRDNMRYVAVEVAEQERVTAAKTPRTYVPEQSPLERAYQQFVESPEMPERISALPPAIQPQTKKALGK